MVSHMQVLTTPSSGVHHTKIFFLDPTTESVLVLAACSCGSDVRYVASGVDITFIWIAGTG